MTHTVKWLDRGREPKCKPNPAYPHGIDIDEVRGMKPGCKVELPYPAERCGVYIVRCDDCGVSYAITTAGRPDDPRSVVMACKGKTQ